MPSVETRILDVIDRCYAGVLDDDAWQGALVAVADLVGGTGTFVFAMRPASQTIVRYDIARLDGEAIALYDRLWAPHDVRVGPGLQARVGAPQTEETLLPTASLRHSAIYNDFLQPHDLTHILATWLHRSTERVVGLSIQGTRHRGAFTPAERERLAPLLPHITRAIELKDRLSLGAGISNSLTTIADRLSLGILLVDARGRMFEASRVGLQILTRADGLFTEAGRIVFRRRRDGQAFSRLLTTAHSLDSLEPALIIPRQRSPFPLSLLVAPIRSVAEPWMTAVQQWIVVIKDPSELPVPAPDDVAREWHVTPAEARVICLLARGSSVVRIAAIHGVSAHTVRSQLKSVYAKTGITSQLEVVRRLLTGAAGNAL